MKMRFAESEIGNFPGFTIPELTVAMVVIGLLGVVLLIARTKGARDDTAIHAASNDIIKACELARSDAVRLNQLHWLRFDQAHHCLRVEREVSNHVHQTVYSYPVPPEVCWSFGALLNSDTGAENFRDSFSQTQIDNDATITFNSDGTADNCSIHLLDYWNGGKFLLCIDRETERFGRIRPLEQ